MDGVAFEAAVAQAVRERDTLIVEAGHSIDCWRCAHTEFTDEQDAVDARSVFHERGWRTVKTFQMCPECIAI